MKTISSSNILRISVINNGRLLLSTTLRGFESIQQVIRHIAASLLNRAGLFVVKMTNIDEGWSYTRSLNIA